MNESEVDRLCQRNLKRQKNENIEEKVNVVSELRLTYPLMILLKISGLSKSAYYYTLAKTDKDDKNKEIIEKIKESIHHIKELLAK